MSGSQELINEEQGSSESGTPVFSWSPLPPRRHLNYNKNEIQVKQINELEHNLYPNYDANIWLRSCEKEILTPLSGTVKGTIPTWLNGSLIRNGPGSLKVGNEEFTHIFDGSALLHRFSIKNGKVTYQCRFLDSEVFRKNWAAKRIVVTEFGTKIVADPCHSIFKRITAIFNTEPSDNASISVYPFGDKLYAFGEIPIIHEINPDTLKTEGKVKIEDYVSIVNHTSHPHVLNDGTVYNLGLSVYATGPYHTIIEYPKNESGNSKEMFQNAKIVASIPARWTFNPAYMHSFGITDNFFIIVEQPLSISVPGIISMKFKNEPVAGLFRWYHEEYTRISVVSRTTGKVYRTFYAEPFCYFHVINQYEDEDHIVIDICIYKDPYVLECMYIETMKTMHQNPDYSKMYRSRPARFILPMNPDQTKSENKNLIGIKNTNARAFYLPNGDVLVEPEKLCDLGCELPRINYENYLGKSYRYFYAMSADIDAENPGTLIKVDTHNKTAVTWSEKNCYPSEPIFVPSPESTEEDDGIILSALVWDGEDTNHVGLLVLDGKTFKELGRAEFKTDSPVPKCFHGWFLPQSDGTLSAMVWGRGEDTNHVGLLVLDGQTFKELGANQVSKCLHGWFLP